MFAHLADTIYNTNHSRNMEKNDTTVQPETENTNKEKLQTGSSTTKVVLLVNRKSGGGRECVDLISKLNNVQDCLVLEMRDFSKEDTCLVNKSLLTEFMELHQDVR